MFKKKNMECESLQVRASTLARTHKRNLEEFGYESDHDISEDVRKRFMSAASFVQLTTHQIPQKHLLELYANFKLATFGKANPKNCPSFFDVKGKAKFDVWKAAGDLPKETAMRNYVDIVEKLNLGWNAKEISQWSQGFGLRPSRPRTDGSECEPGISGLEDPVSKKRVLWFVACKADDVDTAKQLLDDNHDILEVCDEHLGMTALQWAIDSGAEKVVEWLIKEGANVNATDPEGNTPLHFAAYCGRESSARLLVAAGADKTCVNADGLTPGEVADYELMVELLRP